MTKTTPELRQYQCDRLAKKIKESSSSYSFFSLLTSELLFDELEARLPDHRERRFPPTETLSMFLSQALSSDRSCQHAVNRHAVECLSGGFEVGSVRTGGYCRARKRLPLDLVEGLTGYLGQQIETLTPPKWLWRSRPVRIVDGTTLSMPDTEANQEAWPQPGSQKPGLGFPICRLVGITSLETGAVVSAAIGRFKGKGGDEQTLLRGLLDSFSHGDVILGDAYFATYFFMAKMQSGGVDILLEQNGSRRLSTDFRKGTKLGPKDHIIEILKPKKRPAWMTEEEYESAPQSLQMREFKSKRRVFITSMACSKGYKRRELAELYQRRWNIELDFRHIKETLGMGTLSCKTPEMVRKEIWVYLLAYNLLRVLMAQSATLYDLMPRQLSFKHCLQLWVWTLVQLKWWNEEQIAQFLGLIVQQRNGHRPGRIEPRAVKRRPKPYPLMTERREKLRAKIERNGHPKKLK